jgi:hypothetical protein
MFQLQPGDVVKLNETIVSTYACDNWKTGLYKVTDIHVAFGATGKDRTDPRCQSYGFVKVKKDGTAYRKSYGYNALAFDKKFLDTGKAVRV